ncbi:receptor-like protein kinase ANXUR2 isoform X2 [Glycine soja]|uniref:receptor-like protein kinase ANXUR2 isoform X2 n=1 Tax=Glycine soja TaxID=3848 RepID=UPI001038F9B6|nr:receptor-like protein kinase ANXUR2 isoform X2 [Glycine soja]
MLFDRLAFCCSKHTSSSQTKYPTVIEELCHQFSLANLKKSTNNFDENGVIGYGRFGKVYKGCLQHNDGSDYSVTLKRLDVKDSRGLEQFKNEIELLCQLRHPNCVSLIGFCNHKKEKILVYEYMSNGSLHQHLRGGLLSWKKRPEICIEAAHGLHYLHTGAKRTIIHRNINPSNILLDNNMKSKLTDFRLSIQGPRYGSKPKPIKVYVIEEVVCGRNCLIIPTETEVLEKPVEENIDQNIKGKIAPECWQVFIDIIIRCLKYEPDERPTMGEVEVQLEHALSMQEQADITNTNSDYTLFSTTTIHLGLELESNPEESDT